MGGRTICWSSPSTCISAWNHEARRVGGASTGTRGVAPKITGSSADGFAGQDYRSDGIARLSCAVEVALHHKPQVISGAGVFQGKRGGQKKYSGPKSGQRFRGSLLQHGMHDCRPAHLYGGRAMSPRDQMKAARTWGCRWSALALSLSGVLPPGFRCQRQQACAIPVNDPGRLPFGRWPGKNGNGYGYRFVGPRVEALDPLLGTWVGRTQTH